MKKNIAISEGHSTDLPASTPDSDTRRVPVNFQCNEDLLQAVSATRGRNGDTFRKAVEWGLRAYVLKHNPGLAQKLGIKP